MPKRAEPDEILKQIVKLSSGRHKIYLGYAPAVGKTYRMLEEALELKKKNIDIVIGYLELQNRSDNEELIKPFEVISKKKYIINNKEFYDLNLEAIIERKPATVVIDELAHTNIPGSLNQKRYQDIQELLKNGISVLSCLNIHQLDSIVPIVEKQLGIKINETIPDWVLNQANEVVLIDVPIDEVYNRLKNKNIYSQEQLNHALKNFFKRSNLTFLRDLALNVLAERVEIEVVSEKLKAKIKDRVLAFTYSTNEAFKLLENAYKVATITHGDLDILCITDKNGNKETIEKIRNRTKSFKGNFFLIKDIRRKISEEIIQFITVNRITQIIMQYPIASTFKDLFRSNLVFKILKSKANVDILLVGKNETIHTKELILKESISVKQTEERLGKLKIYIGMAPGVGKTYKMLLDGRDLISQGKKVLLGVIDTHGRADTAKLMDNLPILPTKLIEHKGKYLQEFDLEAAIMAKPEYILVDELAHANVPGSINNKRHQDVQYLLRAGINVLTTVNIQHIESLNDIVEQVTGIKVRETVPDWVISHATEVILIDLSPEDLQERLKAGKVYTIDKIEQALTHFFQKKNLIALRELSLREVAENLEHEIYPQGKKLKIISFVDINENTLRLIRKSARISNRMQAELIVVHITKSTKKLSEEKKLVIIELEQLIVELGGDFRLIEGDNIIKEIIKLEEKIKPDYIILGEPKRKGILSAFKTATIKIILNTIKDPHLWIVCNLSKEND